MTRDGHYRRRLERHRSPSLVGKDMPSDDGSRHAARRDAVVDCGWGRLIFAHTFSDNRAIADTLLSESSGQRDIALYVSDPHVLLAMNPQELFLDPSHTYRLWLDRYDPPALRPRGFIVRLLNSPADAEALYALYRRRDMVPPPVSFMWGSRGSRMIHYFIAADIASGEVIGGATGVDHVHAFDDPERGSSLWALAVEPQATHPGIGQAIVRHMAEFFIARGRNFLDLSVMHDNVQAIRLYERLHFERVPVFAVKRKNVYNEPLYIGHQPEDELNPYARIIVREAARRGIGVSVIDVEGGYFELSLGGRSITCRESLSELTSAIAMSRCDDKAVTHRLLSRAGLAVPAQEVAADMDTARRFLRDHGAVVVKPARGEQGQGISVGVRDEDDLERAVGHARAHCDTVLLEEFVEGEDLRIIVIDGEVVAAAVRRPAAVTGNGRDTVSDLIAKASRRRSAATDGESRIPMDDETARCVAAAGRGMDDVLEAGVELTVRSTANLHTGGTIHDVTERLNPALGDAAVRAARAIGIPVTGLDLIVPSVEGEQYRIIEANERPGLANHEPQPTAERFIDLLFPHTANARSFRTES